MDASAGRMMTPHPRILLRATNWVGDAVMSLPAVEQIRLAFPQAHLAVLARPWVAGLYRQPVVDEVILYTAATDWKDLLGRWRLAAALRARRFDMAILLPNAFDAALLAWMAGIPVRIGYAVQRRGPLLTAPVTVPAAGEIPRHQSYYYLELLRRASLLQALPEPPLIRFHDLRGLRRAGERRLPGVWIGVAPGSANGHAKRWLPDRFAAAAAAAATAAGAKVAVFGSPDDRVLCDRVADMVRGRGVDTINFAGITGIGDVLELTAACAAFIANDSGSMHMADALGVPTVAVFGPTDPEATGPGGPLSAVVREPVDCGPCLLHECPLDHRCMEAVQAGRVAAEVTRVLGLARSDAPQGSTETVTS
jgi:heptosyltransferase-2